MKTKLTLALAAALGTSSAFAETKALDPHVHGIATLQIVQDGQSLAVTLDSPAASLLGFEHAPQTEAQHTAVEQLTVQLESFDGALLLNAAAACSVSDADIAVLADVDHDDHGHGDEHHDEDKHGDEHHDEHHDEDKHGDEHHDEHHDEDKHGDEHHDEHHDEDKHGDEHHDEHHDEDKHGDEHHDEHHDDHDEHEGEGSVHSEVNASWMLSCESPADLTSLEVLLFEGNPYLETVTAEVLLESGPLVQELTPDSRVLTFK